MKVVLAGGSGALGRRLRPHLAARGHEVVILTRGSDARLGVAGLGAWALRTDPMLALTGRRASPHRLVDAGFAFTHPALREALHDLMSR